MQLNNAYIHELVSSSVITDSSMLQLEMITAKTPEMVQNELWMQLLAYNLLITLLWHSSQKTQAAPLRLLLQGTRQLFNHFRPLLAQASTCDRQCLYYSLLLLLQDLPVPLRPGRAEP